MGTKISLGYFKYSKEESELRIYLETMDHKYYIEGDD